MIHVLQGDSIDVLRTLPAACLDAVVTDPPYGLSSAPNMVEVLTKWLAGEDYTHRGGGFMGKTWDSFVPGPSLWREVYRVMKPGAYGISFFGTRTYHLGTIAIALAGFEVRDMLSWLYGSGFPKSLDVSKAIDAALGHERPVTGTRTDGVGNTSESMHKHEGFARSRDKVFETTGPGSPEAEAWDGWGTALKPACEPIALFRKPLEDTVAANVLRYGTGGINVDACRIESERVTGWGGSALYEGGLSRHGGEARPAEGRWPANVIMDEAAGEILDEQTGAVPGQRGGPTGDEPSSRTTAVFGKGNRRQTSTPRKDKGGASRFFYCAKASKAEREAGCLEAGLPLRTGGDLTDREDGSDGLKSPRAGAGRGGGRRNNHPTVKPVALMRWLVRLVARPGAFVLDPFAGSGTTLIAAALEGVRAVGIELDAGHVEIIKARVAHAQARPEEFKITARQKAVIEGKS